MGDFHTAVALIVATDTEETAVRHMYEWTQRTFAEDGQPYYEACFSRGSEEHRVVYARQGEMGMAAAASPENQCHVHIGPMACGTSVVANRDVLEKQVRSQLQGTVALDMESYAVAYAAEHAVEPRPVPLIIKSVCDYADAQKSDQYQKFAAFTSCEYAKLLYEKFLPLKCEDHENDFTGHAFAGCGGRGQHIRTDRRCAGGLSLHYQARHPAPAFGRGGDPAALAAGGRTAAVIFVFVMIRSSLKSTS